MARGTFASTFGSGLQGAVGGGNIGAQVGGVPGALVGAGIGALGGGLGGYFAAEADEPMNEAQLQQLLLSNKISELQYRQMIQKMREDKKAQMNRNKVGRLVAEKLMSGGSQNTFAKNLGGM